MDNTAENEEREAMLRYIESFNVDLPDGPPISTVEMSPRLRRALEWHGVETIPQMVMLSPKDILGWVSCGPKLRDEFRDIVGRYGSFKATDPVVRIALGRSVGLLGWKPRQRRA